MKKLYRNCATSLGILFTLPFTILPAFAEVGIGVSFKSNDASLYIPWQITPAIRLEGELRQVSQETEQRGVTTIASTTQNTVYTSDNDATEIGTGLFWTNSLQNNITLLLGLRLNYVESESSNYQTVSSTISVSSKSDLDGFEWAPTLGLEYSITDKIKVAAEVNYFKQDLDGKGRSVQTGGFSGTVTNNADLEASANGTNTRLILRYFF